MYNNLFGHFSPSDAMCAESLLTDSFRRAMMATDNSYHTLTFIVLAQIPLSTTRATLRA